MIKITKLIILSIISLLLFSAVKPNHTFDFRIRTITAGITLENLDDISTINEAITFLEKSKKVFVDKGYEVQTTRISTQNLHELIPDKPTKQNYTTT